MKTIKKVQTKKDIEDLENLGVIIEFEPQEEEISPVDQFDNEAAAQKICDRYNNGFLEAWFCAKVTVKYKGLEEDDYLGCCSYKSFKQFTDGITDYYGDMINTCIDQINKDIDFNNSEIIKHWTIRKAKNMVRPYGLIIMSKKALELATR